MSEEKKDLLSVMKEAFQQESREYLENRARQRFAELRSELEELEAEIKANHTVRPAWPGAIEPLILAAAFLLHGEGDVDAIADKAVELSSDPLRIEQVRFAVHRLARRGLLSENERCFTITPEGERQLSNARSNAKRWIEALDNWPGAAK